MGRQKKHMWPSSYNKHHETNAEEEQNQTQTHYY